MNQTAIIQQTVRRFLAALVRQDAAEVNHLLRPDVGLQIRGEGRMEIYWTRARAHKALLAEFARGAEPRLTILDVHVAERSVLAAFQLQAVEDGRLVKRDRSMTLTFQEGQIAVILLYCYDEMIQARLQRWFVPVPLVNVLATDMGLQCQYAPVLTAG